ncbi:hypothetical protein [Pedobacter sp. SYSU D00535]|uniref:hypothetical protein n=1 Tax=Pedobacter sp. SYSU D00535 TaxID=2810308 RepID=UPI001A9720C9|nr:hypothetical protein [Pedobacter sp. SYSU D00535]
MKDFDALRGIWQGQVSAPRLSEDEVLKEVRRSKSSFASKLLFETLGMSVAILVFVLIWATKAFSMWTSHLSILIFIFCCLYYIVLQIADYRSISNSDALLKQPEEYVEYLKFYQRKRYQLNTKKYTVYSVFIGLAFALYFVEVYFTAPLWQTLTGVGFTIAWFVACAFLMRVYIRKEQDRLGEMIESLEKLKKQFEEDE